MTVSTSWWPADTSEPVLETTVGGVLRTAAQRAPDHTALVGGIADPARRRWTYAALLAETERVARALLARVAQDEGKIQKFVLRDWLANNILAPLTATRQER